MEETARLLFTVYGVAVHHLDRFRAVAVADKAIEALYARGLTAPSARQAMDVYDEMVAR